MPIADEEVALASRFVALQPEADVVPRFFAFAHDDPDLSLIRANEAWDAVGGAANAGAGVKVAVIDSGIDNTHPCFSDAGYPAQTKIGEAFSGISEDMADVGMAMDRAENKVETMRARAGAIDELLESGALDDLSVGGDVVDRELTQIASQSAVEADLARLKGELGAGSPPAGQIGGGQS